MDKGKYCVVVGATGDVGRGITAELLKTGAQVIAVGRNANKLQRLQSEMGTFGALQTLTGEVSRAPDAARLSQQLTAIAPSIGSVIVSVNTSPKACALKDLGTEQFLQTLQDNLLTHHAALQALVPILAAGGTYLAIGGGLADWVVPGMGAMSVCQAGQRAMLKTFAAEHGGEHGVRIRELMLHSMITGESNRDKAQPNWITDEDVGRHVLTILNNLEAFPETVINLKSRKQVGQLPAPAP